MAYATMHASYGLQRMAQAEAIGVTENKIYIVAI